MTLKSDYYELRDLVGKTDKEFDPEILRNELYAIAMEELSSYFVELYHSGKTYDNPSNSLVAWLIGITDEEPTESPAYSIKQGRQSMPDIDIDIDDRTRDLVIERCREVYGKDNVAHIATFGSVKAKSAIKDAARALGYDYDVAEKLNAAMPAAVHGVTKTLDEALATSDFHKAASESEISKEITSTALRLEGVLRQHGVHAAGVVVAPSDVTNFVPVMQRRTKTNLGPVVTQWAMDRVEEAGLLKLDFLGLRNLGVIDMCLDLVKETLGEEVDIDNIPLDDETTYEELRNGNSIGLFQVESSGLRRMMMAMQPDCIEDIMALIALYRPGPLGSNMDKLYIDNKHGRETADLHPALEPLLESSNGTMLYQEDVLNISRKIAGFSAAKADGLRKALGKKIPEKLAQLRDDFIDGTESGGLMTADEASELWSQIEYFAAYGFNRAHSASYGVIAYQTAYLKFNYPTQYMAALLSSVSQKKEKTTVYLNECRRMGINVLPPSINKSGEQYTIEENGDILIGLGSINGLGEATIAEILERRDKYGGFESLTDTWKKIGPQSTKKSIFQHLVFSGALDEMLPPREQSLLLSFQDKNEMLTLEREELGMFVTQNPLTSAWHLVAPQVTLVEELYEMMDGFYGKIGGIITEVNEKKTRSNKLMYIFQVEDVTGAMECVAFPRVAERVTPAVGQIVFIEGRLQIRGDEENSFISYIVNTLEEVKIPENASVKPVFIRLNYMPSEQEFDIVEETIVDNPGDKPVYLSFPDSQGNLIEAHFKRPTTPDAAQRIKEML